MLLFEPFARRCYSREFRVSANIGESHNPAALMRSTPFRWKKTRSTARV
jgi:hypothetical protein